MTKLISQILSDAADLIEPEGAWTQGVSARQVNGLPAGIFSDEACSWCLVGALDKAARNPRYANAAWVEVNRRTSRDFRKLPVRWNDQPDRKQSEVVGLLRKVSNELKERGK